MAAHSSAHRATKRLTYISQAYSEGTLREQYSKIFDTNLFGASVTVEAFLPLLKKSIVPGGKRIAFTSSGLASIKLAEDITGNYAAKFYPVYRSTKTAMSMIMLHYAQILGEEGFVVSASDPGYCATNLNKYSGLKDPREGAKALIRCAVAPKEEVHGALVDETSKLPW
jgi:NAD(P)-dependent dehydrogenase (short-subunit alcohol dehydrogenase family)